MVVERFKGNDLAYKRFLIRKETLKQEEKIWKSEFANGRYKGLAGEYKPTEKTLKKMAVKMTDNLKKEKIIMATNEWTLYLDESGNTGTNMFDDKQPFYVYGGWLVKKDSEENVINYISESFKKVKAKELKSVNILKRHRPKLYEFLKNSINNEMFPFYYVFEKNIICVAKLLKPFLTMHTIATSQWN